MENTLFNFDEKTFDLSLFPVFKEKIKEDFSHFKNIGSYEYVSEDILIKKPITVSFYKSKGKELYHGLFITYSSDIKNKGFVQKKKLYGEKLIYTPVVKVSYFLKDKQSLVGISILSKHTPIKILNLYAGIGGNRKLWKDVDVTAVEHNEAIANIYSDFYPKDKMIIGDAHAFLLEHFKKFDFIWSSPPCQSHSSFRHNLCVPFRGTLPVYPDMSLYQEILFLQHNAKCNWVVENVKPYYKPLIEATLIQRHLFWSNFIIPTIEIKQEKLRSLNKVSELEALHGFNLSKYKLPNKRQVLRNCVNADIGLHILKQVSTKK